MKLKDQSFPRMQWVKGLMYTFTYEIREKKKEIESGEGPLKIKISVIGSTFFLV